MFLKNEVIGFIPARGGSKSIPLKNIFPLSGQPLISYSFRCAKASTTLTELVCSTDHEAIADVCKTFGVPVDWRRAELAADDTPVAEVLRDYLTRVIQTAGECPEFLALIQPTSPFTRGADIDAAVHALRDRNDVVSAQTVTQVPHNLHAFNQRIVEDGLIRFRYQEERAAAYNKQRKPKHFQFGNTVVTRTEALLDGQDCFGQRSAFVEIDRRFAFDLDTPEDVDIAETMIRAGHILLDNPS